MEYVDVDDPRIRLYSSCLSLGKEIPYGLDASESYLVSAEDLHSTDPFFWEDRAEKNQRFFGSDCHVLLTIREPKSYLTSLYVQLCIHQGNVQAPEDLFLENALYSPHLASAKFAIDYFSYNRIIALYKAHFDALTVAKFESLGKMDFLKELFPVSEQEREEYKGIFLAEKANRAYSKTAVTATLTFQRVLNSVGLSLNPSTVRGDLLRLHQLRHPDTGRRGGDISRQQGLLGAMGMKVTGIFRWASLMRRLDMYYPYRRFELDFDRLPQIDVAWLAEEYDRLPDLAIYRKHENR
ncbi:MAG: hypothetical protein M0T84_10375 [Betaproteobacteria bacterium]|nr:hypothetical protein [Betaproteobacteria bacterium]